MRRLIKYVIFLLFLGTQTSWGQSKVGSTAAPFLGISVAPRATSMGNAFAAVANDASTVYYNPGGLAGVPGAQLLFSHTDWLVDSKFNWIGFSFNLDGTNAIAFSIMQLDYGEEEVTTVLQPEGTGAFWSASDMVGTVAYSRALTDLFSVGGSVKYVRQKIYNESASAYALDIGLLFKTEFNDMKLGMSISNFGTDVRFDGRDLLQRVDLDENAIGHNETIIANLKTEDWPLPLFFRVGLAMDVFKNKYNRFTVAVDAFRPSDNTETINLGCEYGLNEWVFLRAGYKSLFRDDSEEGLTFGAGLNYNLGTAGAWSIDYSFVDFGLFENIQMFSIKVSR